MKNVVISQEEAQRLNPIVLAFVGDAVHTLYVREGLAKNSDAKAGELHTAASKVVSAVNQSKLSEVMLPLLTVEEADIYKRARNAHTHSVAKNADLLDYKRASGYEAVIGYLYLTGQEQRLMQMLQIGD